MRKILSAALVLVMLVTLMVPCAMAAEANTEQTPAETSSMDASGGGFTDKLLSAEKPEAEAGQESSPVANIVVFVILAVVVGVSVAMIIDKKKKLYK